MWPDSEHSWNYVIVIDPSLWNLLPRTSSINFCASLLEQYFLDTRRILMWLLEHTNQCSDIPSKLLLSFFIELSVLSFYTIVIWTSPSIFMLWVCMYICMCNIHVNLQWCLVCEKNAIVLGYLFCLCHCLYINMLMMCNTFDWKYFFPDTSV